MNHIGINKRNFILYIILPLALCAVICGIIFLHNKTVAYASEEIQSEETEKYIYDEAGILTDSEIEKLEDLSKEYKKEAGIEIFVLTHNDKNSTYPEKYIEDFEDKLPAADRVYFLYDMYRGEIFIEGYGLAETYIHSKRIDKIFDSLEDDLKSGYYFNAFETYITMAAAYMKDDSDLNYDHNYIYESVPEDFDQDNEYSYDDYGYEEHYEKQYKKDRLENNIFFNIWFQIFLSLIIGGIAVGIMAFNSGGRMTAGANDYMDRSKSGLIGRRDQYTHSTVTKTRKPSNNSTDGGVKHSRGYNSGGFRGGSSSGGRSHSSGGRKL